MARPKSADVSAETGNMPAYREDTTASAIGTESAADVMRELEAKAGSAGDAPGHPGYRGGTVSNRPHKHTEMIRDSYPEHVLLEDFGGVIEGDTIRFGQKVFPRTHAGRLAIAQASRANLAAGPRRTTVPEIGAFLPYIKSFRGVPYRTKSGAMKVDW